MIYLYVKQHAISGLKYFGKTIKQDPYNYMGSGTYWKSHINKHGKDHVTTLELWKFENQEECTKFALKFSEENDIVNSSDWANLCYEDGLSSGTTGLKHKDSTKQKISNKRKQYLAEIDLTGENNSFFGKTHTNETKVKIRNKLKGRALENTHKENISKAQIGRVVSQETRDKIRKTMTGKKHSKERIAAIAKGRRKSS